MTSALDYGRRAERQRPEEPDVDPQVRFCERGRSKGRPLLDPVASEERAPPPDNERSGTHRPGRGGRKKRTNTWSSARKNVSLQSLTTFALAFTHTSCTARYLWAQPTML